MKHTAGFAVAFATVLALATPTPAATETVLYRFQGGSDGAEPEASLIADRAGNLYTTTLGGGVPGCIGNLGCGTIIKLSPPAGEASTWTETVLYRFQGNGSTGGQDAANPDTGLVKDKAGNFYAVALGGAGSCWLTGCGAVIKLSRPATRNANWTETILYAFKRGTDGFYPSGLAADASGNLFVTAAFGGFTHGSECASNRHQVGGCGALIRLSPPAPGATTWGVAVLRDFEGNFKGQTDGDSPRTDPIIDASGNLYTTTIQGGGVGCGGYGCGTLVKLSPPAAGSSKWVSTVLYTFESGNPSSGLLADGTGNLYTTTVNGSDCQGYSCGAVVKLTPPTSPTGAWMETVLYRFKGGTDGSYPWARLIADKAGNLFTTTEYGGGSGCNGVGCGTIVKLSPPLSGDSPWTEKMLYRLRGGADGATPTAALSVDWHGNLYTTTYFGGGSGCANNFGCGTIIELSHAGFILRK